MNPQDYGLPDNYCVTTETWTDAGEPVLAGATSGNWHTNSRGEFAVLKPTARQPGREEPFREWLASRLAQRIGVNVSIVELLDDPSGPGALVYATKPRAFRYTDATAMTAEAKDAFRQYTGIVVLDALVGARDRSTNNLVYHEPSKSWYSIDYSHCFGIDAGLGIAIRLDHPHLPSPNYPEDVKAALDDVEPMAAALLRVEAMDDKEIEDLCAEPPARFYQGDRTKIVEYLLFRKRHIRAIVNDWLAVLKKPPIRKC